MFRPLECFIGLRYVRSRRRRGVVSFMSAASLVGMALGVAALIVILSVMNGLETETRTRLLSMTEHASVSAPRVGLADWRGLQSRLASLPGVSGVSPYVMLEGMLAAGPSLQPVLVRGVLPGEEKDVSDIERYLRAGTLDSLEPGRIILGRILALNLGLDIGDRVNLLVPRIRNGRPDPGFASFAVSGIFEAGFTEHDAGLALVHMSQASELKELGGSVEGLSVRLDEPLAVGALRERLLPGLDPSLRYSDWTDQHANLLRAIRIEKRMMTIILMFIVGVAAFNIVASLMMVVTDKEKDIAILRTYGLEPARVARVFLVQGAVIGLAGTLAGAALGLVLAFNIDVIVPWLESAFNFKIMPGDVYYVTELPSEVHLADVIFIPVLAFLVAALATIYPSRRAAAIAPAEALRYD
jgi:lipoprotein-releasing system permease protein